MFLVITRYKEDVSWVKEVCPDYLIYNKGGDILDDEQAINVPNIGGNQYDICKFIHDNYENLPDVIAFLQANPFDHCSREKFNRLIWNWYFTPIESFEHVEDGDATRKDYDGGYTEINDSWYIAEHNKKLVSENKELTCKFTTFDEFMGSLFTNYEHLNWIRFTPASQYIVTRANCLNYSKAFWKNLIDIFPTIEGVNGGTEAHLMERAMFYILTGRYNARIK